MTLTATNVRTGITGEVSVGLLTATPPVTAAEALTGYDGLGYVGPDGVIPKSEKTAKDLTAWQNNAIVRTLVSDAKRTYEFTLWETSLETIEFAYGLSLIHI